MAMEELQVVIEDKMWNTEENSFETKIMFKTKDGVLIDVGLSSEKYDKQFQRIKEFEKRHTTAIAKALWDMKKEILREIESPTERQLRKDIEVLEQRISSLTDAVSHVLPMCIKCGHTLKIIEDHYHCPICSKDKVKE